MADEEEIHSSETLKPSFPTGRVKKIVKFDKDITRITSEALFLVSGATELFLHFLTEKSAEIAVEKKRKNIKVDYLRLAVKRHQPTRDFLLDSLPMPSSQPLDEPPADRTVKRKSVLPPNTRRIDSFFW
uniref:Transcription factor CBF/NF-Y/archaeal histone domain-containing protein n=1 Tax=Chenopodium quinoa TaxID=63459 RepID=A0A803M6P2_CHEQI